ncbi:hypothetical protein D7Z54_10170 [Salibacterium salarium]|uniref:ABC-transporter type IV n=1 Tax=Salibacterium salarium TaxID=284579 RepID=A0A428N502_9BACI|nr:CBO0543 family protein [Salibacterium salarium]RSL33332.1 hypothetical protein D7Z54_10170 [Salibacterium salarium]
MKPSILNEILETYERYIQLQEEHYFENVLFSYQWWILVFIPIVLWVTWALLVDKTRMNSILLAGLLATLLAVVLDDIGLSLGLWQYPYRIVPFTSRLNPIDIGIIPVFYMLVYQYFQSWKVYTIIITLLSLFAVFMAEPLFGRLGMYLALQWEYWYSGPIYILIGIFVKWLVDKVKKNPSIHGER